jgi:drug/metabolite transporter (DMT)-like permease
MSLAVAVPFGVGSAVVYGASIVVQHRAAQEHAGEEGESAAGLLRTARNPIFLMAIAGDLVGFLLQLVALSAGPVVVIQPLVVLMLPVALAVGFFLGGHKPVLGDYLGVVSIVVGLGVFLALIGVPGHEHVPKARYTGLTIGIVLVVGFALVLAVTGRSRVLRGAVFGAVAGIFFGTLAVMIDATSDRFSHHGWHGVFVSSRGLVTVVGWLLCGAAGIVLTQVSFQIGALKATLPANLATDPLTAVLIGATLLRERLPLSPWHVVAYVACLGAVLAGTIRLANPASGPTEADLPPPDELEHAPPD